MFNLINFARLLFLFAIVYAFIDWRLAIFIWLLSSYLFAVTQKHFVSSITIGYVIMVPILYLLLY